MYSFFFFLFAFNKTRTVDELIFRFEFFSSSSYSCSSFGSHLLARTLDPFRSSVQSMKRAPCGAWNLHTLFSHHNPFVECTFLWKCIMYIKTPYLILYLLSEWMNWNFFWFSFFLLLCLLAFFALAPFRVLSSFSAHSWCFFGSRFLGSQEEELNSLRCFWVVLFLFLSFGFYDAPKLSKVAMWEIFLRLIFFCCFRDCHYSIANRHKILSARYMCPHTHKHDNSLIHRNARV